MNKEDEVCSCPGESGISLSYSFCIHFCSKNVDVDRIMQAIKAAQKKALIYVSPAFA